MNYFSYSFYPQLNYQPQNYSLLPLQQLSGEQIFCLSSENFNYVKKLETENSQLKERNHQLEEKLKNYKHTIKTQPKNHSDYSEQQKKQQIEVHCTYNGCEKSYKSTLALNLHIRIKHKGGSIRERQAYAKLILQCQKNNRPAPAININFPPNFMENYRKRQDKHSIKWQRKDSQ